MDYEWQRAQRACARAEVPEPSQAQVMTEAEVTGPRGLPGRTLQPDPRGQEFKGNRRRHPGALRQKYHRDRPTRRTRCTMIANSGRRRAGFAYTNTPLLKDGAGVGSIRTLGWKPRRMT